MTNRRSLASTRGGAWIVSFAALVVAAVGCGREPAAAPDVPPASRESSAPIRLAGTVEATRSYSVIVPRLAGQTAPTLVITGLVPTGAKVSPGDRIVEFDRQEQIRLATERRAEMVDLDGQIRKKQSELDIARVQDETELAQAQSNVERAALDVKKNDLVARVEAEKNTLALEQATARLAQLRETFALKRIAADAELKILQIQRERAARALRHAEGNATLMSIAAPFGGLVVLKQIWKGNTQAEVQQGEEVRPGIPILEIVDPAGMQVRSRVSQADVAFVVPGQPATIRLDAYPELQFKGRVETVAPLGVPSSLSPKVRTFTAVVSIEGMSPQLLPDLSASVEIDTARPAVPAQARNARDAGEYR